MQKSFTGDWRQGQIGRIFSGIQYFDWHKLTQIYLPLYKTYYLGVNLGYVSSIRMLFYANEVRMTTVAVIIPCFRDAATLGWAIDSVLAQSHRVNEVIVVNDASPETEAIEAVLECYPEVRYLVSQTNQGLAATRNIGLLAAKSDVVSFLDADDQLHPEKIRLQLSVLKNDLSVAVTCDVSLFDQPGPRAFDAGQSGRLSVSFFENSKSLLFRNKLTGAALMARRELLLEHGGYDASLRSCEDFDLWLRLLDAKVKVIKLSLPLYSYYVNPAGLSKNYRNISSWELAVLTKYFSRNKVSRLYESIVLFFWLSKHFARASLSADAELAEMTILNAQRLFRLKFMARLFCLLSGSGFFTLLAKVLRRAR